MHHNKFMYITVNGLYMLAIIYAMIINHPILNIITAIYIWTFIALAAVAAVLAYYEPTITKHQRHGTEPAFGVYVDYVYDLTISLILLLNGWYLTALFYLILPILTYIVYKHNRRN